MIQWPWPEGPKNPQRPVDEVHVWAATIGRSPAGLQDLCGLSPDEVERARGAGSEAYQAEFVRSRVLLRKLLGHYLSLDPDRIELVTNEHGKPALAPSVDTDLRFNLTHTAGMALFAFAHGREVGIDMDRLDRVASWEGIAKRSFSEQERATIMALPEPERRESFMRGWIRKEAYAKARGAGFQYGFSKFSVSLESGGHPPLLLDDANDPGATANWGLQDIPVEYPLAAALGTRSQPKGGLPEVLFWSV